MQVCSLAKFNSCVACSNSIIIFFFSLHFVLYLSFNNLITNRDGHFRYHAIFFFRKSKWHLNRILFVCGNASGITLCFSFHLLFFFGFLLRTERIVEFLNHFHDSNWFFHFNVAENLSDGQKLCLTVLQCSLTLPCHMHTSLMQLTNSKGPFLRHLIAFTVSWYILFLWELFQTREYWFWVLLDIYWLHF